MKDIFGGLIGYQVRRCEEGSEDVGSEDVGNTIFMGVIRLRQQL